MHWWSNYVYDFLTESYYSAFTDIDGYSLNNAIWENEDVFFVQNSDSEFVRYDLLALSSENLGQTRNNSAFDICSIDNSVYYFSAEGESVDLGYHSFNRYSNGVITELLAFPTPNGIISLKVLNDCSGFLFFSAGGGASHFQHGLYHFDLNTNETTLIEIEPYTYPYHIGMAHINSDYVSGNELFIKLSDGAGGCSYGLLNPYSETITELNIQCVVNSGSMSILSDYSKLALEIDYDSGVLKIYDLPSLSELHTIDMDLISQPHLIKNKWSN